MPNKNKPQLTAAEAKKLKKSMLREKKKIDRALKKLERYS